MLSNNYTDTALNSLVGTGAIIGAPTDIVDVNTAKAFLIATVSSIIFKLAISGLKWVSDKVSKIGKKDKDDVDNNPKMEPAT